MGMSVVIGAPGAVGDVGAAIGSEVCANEGAAAESASALERVIRRNISFSIVRPEFGPNASR